MYAVLASFIHILHARTYSVGVKTVFPPPPSPYVHKRKVCQIDGGGTKEDHYNPTLDTTKVMKNECRRINDGCPRQQGKWRAVLCSETIRENGDGPCCWNIHRGKKPAPIVAICPPPPLKRPPCLALPFYKRRKCQKERIKWWRKEMSFLFRILVFARESVGRNKFWPNFFNVLVGVTLGPWGFQRRRRGEGRHPGPPHQGEAWKIKKRNLSIL